MTQHLATPGTYQSLHSAGVFLSPAFTIPAEAAEDYCARFDLLDSFGFDGYPAGGTGGSRVIQLKRTDGGATRDVFFWGAGGLLDPSGHGPLTVTETIDAAIVIGALAGHEWRWHYVNLDDRESWEIDVAYGVVAPVSTGCAPIPVVIIPEVLFD